MRTTVFNGLSLFKKNFIWVIWAKTDNIYEGGRSQMLLKKTVFSSLKFKVV